MLKMRKRKEKLMILLRNHVGVIDSKNYPCSKLFKRDIIAALVLHTIYIQK